MISGVWKILVGEVAPALCSHSIGHRSPSSAAATLVYIPVEQGGQDYALLVESNRYPVSWMVRQVPF